VADQLLIPAEVARDLVGSGRYLKYDCAPTTAMRMSGPIRAAIMSSAICSPPLTPASKRSATISVSP
jgi:hypothetical protein